MVGVGRSPLLAGVGALLFVLGLTLALLRIGTLRDAGGVRLGAPWVMVDFRHVVYYPTRAFLEGINPYDSSKYIERYPVEIPVSLYPPMTFVLFAPFGLLPLTVAAGAYFLLTVMLTLVLAWVALRLAGWLPGPWTVLAGGGILLLSRPGHWNLLSGQITIIVVLATYIAIIFARRTPWLAATGLAIALMKPSFGLPLVLALIAKRGTKSVGWGVALFAAINLPIVAVLISRAGGLSPFVASLAESVRAFASNPDTDPILGVWRVDLTACISRLLNHPLGAGAGLIITVLVLLPLVLLSRRALRTADKRQERLIDSLLCCAVLLSLFHQAYDLLLLAYPAASLARTISEHRTRSIYVAQAVLFGILGLNYVTTQSVLTALQLRPATRLLVLTINGITLTGLFGLYLAELSDFKLHGRRPQLSFH